MESLPGMVKLWGGLAGNKQQKQVNKQKENAVQEAQVETWLSWYSACFECTKPWVRSQHQKKKKKPWKVKEGTSESQCLLQGSLGYKGPCLK